MVYNIYIGSYTVTSETCRKIKIKIASSLNLPCINKYWVNLNAYYFFF